MDLAKHWRVRAARYRLEGRRELATGTVCFPPEPASAGEGWEPYTLSGRGELYSFSVVRQAPDGFDGVAPYAVGLVRLEEGPLVTAQITDCDPATLTIGMPLELVTRKLRDMGPEGLLVYGYKARPII